MIEPTEADVGRFVVYTPHDGQGPKEYGKIIRVGPLWVHVRYTGQPNSAATRREDLTWADEKR